MRADGATYDQIKDATGISIATLSRLFNERVEEYREVAAENGFKFPPVEAL